MQFGFMTCYNIPRNSSQYVESNKLQIMVEDDIPNCEIFVVVTVLTF